MSNRTAAVLEQAAQVIETRGWNRGGYAPSAPDTDLSTCPVCVLGAINVATCADPVMDVTALGDKDPGVLAAMAFARYLNLDVQNLGDLIDVLGESWNDEIATSAEQVTKALRECAAELSKETTR